MVVALKRQGYCIFQEETKSHYNYKLG